MLRPYHFAWALIALHWHGKPGKRMTVIGVTGTKGKSSVAEMLHSIFSRAGRKTALASTIRFATGAESRPNLFKMTLPGRGFIQAFLANALENGCTHAVVEITSEAVLQHRQHGIELDALVFTNLQKEHIESHGSYENYFRAKLRIGEELVRSSKRPRAIIANADDERGAAFLALPVERKIPFSLSDAHDRHLDSNGVSFTYKGTQFALPQPGEFNILNALAAIKTAEAFGIPLPICAEALRDLKKISGRVERVEAGQDFIAVVDYAHTPDSLRALYNAFPSERKICVLGNTGGGRDTWKRPLMGKIAETYCDAVILTNEDPYDEDPRAIIDSMAAGMTKQPRIIMDRREAIRTALSLAKRGDVVLVSGKGTDPFIMGPNGQKTPWSDAQVVREELERLNGKV
ncbi:MAG TPA: UDP-N-acetylmuramoyl-L-alanyl-D-glutamate--2,6-diaminopimelate ligase [Candidatus Paceibacterota bacterium]|nr:UDP-N-acetylmuramoyl-L-alanyl-D-glutamate--2,6-diaminopimelate ligase [Candidatus Paceibacterota bacterium]